MHFQWHYRPRRNWINDPNGLVHYRGWYHMFYQYNPTGDQWGNIHWGHARSRDLLRWETLPVAMAPDAARGELHCFSGGCCKDEAGKPHFFYTSIGDAAQGRGAVDGAQQWFAEPADDDLSRLIQSGEGALTSAIHPDVPVTDWRDPCVIRHAGQYLMVLGGCVEKRGCVLLYTSPDLRTWTYRHILAMSDSADGMPWECPNLFCADGRVGLIYSPCSQVRVKTGTLDAALCFHEERDEVLDPAAWNGFYAPQTFTDDAGRVILIAWMPECDNVPHKGWAGVMSMPRILHINEEGLVCEPVPGVMDMPGVTRLQVAADELPARWILQDNGRERTALTLDPDGTLTLDRSRSNSNGGADCHPICRSVPVRAVNDVLLCVDGSAVEVLVNGKSLCGRIYPEG